MSITPQDIQDQRFSEAKRGYDPVEVDNFLEQVSAEVEAMLHKIADLKGRLTNAEARLAQTEQGNPQATVAAMPPVAPQPQAADAQQVGSVLIIAQQTADKIVADARHEADSIRSEADSRSREIIRKALKEKETELAEIERLKASREEFRSKYLELIKHFEDEAHSVFPEAMIASPYMTGSANQAPAAKPAPAAQEPANPFDAPVDSVDTDDLD